jgi:hypothetical protein
MAITFAEQATRKRVRNGTGWRTRRTITVRATDDAVADYIPIVVKVTGCPETQADIEVLADKAYVKIQAEQTKRQELADTITEEETTMGGNMKNIFHDRLILNVGQ